MMYTLFLQDTVTYRFGVNDPSINQFFRLDELTGELILISTLDPQVEQYQVCTRQQQSK